MDLVKALVQRLEIQHLLSDMEDPPSPASVAATACDDSVEAQEDDAPDNALLSDVSNRLTFV